MLISLHSGYSCVIKQDLQGIQIIQRIFESDLISYYTFIYKTGAFNINKCLLSPRERFGRLCQPPPLKASKLCNCNLEGKRHSIDIDNFNLSLIKLKINLSLKILQRQSISLNNLFKVILLLCGYHQLSSIIHKT